MAAHAWSHTQLTVTLAWLRVPTGMDKSSKQLLSEQTGPEAASPKAMSTTPDTAAIWVAPG